MISLLLGWNVGLIIFIAGLIIPVAEFVGSPLAGCIIGSILSILSLGIFSWQVYLIISNQNPEYSSLYQLLGLFVLFNVAGGLLWFSIWLQDELSLEFIPPFVLAPGGTSYYYIFLVIVVNTFSIFCTAGAIRMFPNGVLAYLVQLLVVITGGFMWLLTGMWFVKYRTRSIQFMDEMGNSKKN